MISIDFTPELWLIVALVVLTAGASLLMALVARRSKRTLGRTLTAASSIVSSGLAAKDSAGALDDMTRQLSELLDADALVLAVPDGDGRLVIGASHGYPDPETQHLDEDEGMTGRAYTHEEPVIAPDVGRNPHYVERLEGIRSAVAVPMRYEGSVIGVLSIESRGRRFGEDDLVVLVPLADQIAAVFANHRLRRDLEERAQSEEKAHSELQAISSVVMAGVASVNDLDAALNSMIAEIGARMGWDSMALILYGDDGLLHTRAHYGYPEFSTKIAFRPGHGVVGVVAQSGIGRLSRDVTSDPDYFHVVGDTACEMCVPLKAGERVIGVLNAESPRPGTFSEDDFRLLGTLADQMAIVVERARLADLERAALERLRQLDQLKDDFVATVSHELRTPLTSINGYAQTLLLRDGALTEAERRTFLEVIVRQCSRLSTIVESLLLVSQVESGRLATRKDFVLFNETLHDACEAANATGRVRLEMLDGAGLITDQFRLHHILRNLIENACKYSPGESQVLVRVAPAEGVAVGIEVLDSGPGIPEGAEEAVFERFRRLSDPGMSKVPGTGLGLYIARRFANDLGGDITVRRSDHPEFPGACFMVTLEAADVDEIEPPESALARGA